MTMRLDGDLYAEVFERLAVGWSRVTEAVDVGVLAVGCAPAMLTIGMSLPVRGELSLPPNMKGVLLVNIDIRPGSQKSSCEDHCRV